MMKNFNYFILLLTFSLPSYAQMNESLEEQMLEMMRKQHEMMQKMMEEDDFFNSSADKIFKRLRDNGALGNLRGDQLNLANKSLKTKWQENEKSRTFIVFIANKNDEINVDINNGMIKLSGSKSMSDRKGKVLYDGQKFSFSYAVSIPSDVVEKSAKMSSVDGNIHITFQKKVEKKRPSTKFKSDTEI